MLKTQMSVNGPRNAERDSRFAVNLVPGPGRAFCVNEQILREAEPTVRLFQGRSAPWRLDQLLRGLPVQLRPHLSFDYMSLLLRREGEEGTMWYVPDPQDPSTLTRTQSAPSEELLSWVVEHQQAVVIPNFKEETRSSRWKTVFAERALRSVCAVPLATARTRPSPSRSAS